MSQTEKIKIKLYPGQGMFLKHYKSYFEKWLKFVEDISEAQVCLCHSIGIYQMLSENKSLPMVAMDPSSVPETELSLTVYYNDNRDDAISNKTNIILQPYKGDHYPYKNKNIRDKIIKEILRLTSS